MSLLERAVKRYTCLAPLVLPPLLAALAKLPPGSAVSGAADGHSGASMGQWGHSGGSVRPACQGGCWAAEHPTR